MGKESDGEECVLRTGHCRAEDDEGRYYIDFHIGRYEIPTKIIVHATSHCNVAISWGVEGKPELYPIGAGDQNLRDGDTLTVSIEGITYNDETGIVNIG